MFTARGPAGKRLHYCSSRGSAGFGCAALRRFMYVPFTYFQCLSAQCSSSHWWPYIGRPDPIWTSVCDTAVRTWILRPNLPTIMLYAVELINQVPAVRLKSVCWATSTCSQPWKARVISQSRAPLSGAFQGMTVISVRPCASGARRVHGLKPQCHAFASAMRHERAMANGSARASALVDNALILGYSTCFTKVRCS